MSNTKTFPSFLSLSNSLKGDERKVEEEKLLPKKKKKGAEKGGGRRKDFDGEEKGSDGYGCWDDLIGGGFGSWVYLVKKEKSWRKKRSVSYLIQPITSKFCLISLVLHMNFVCWEFKLYYIS